MGRENDVLCMKTSGLFSGKGLHFYFFCLLFFYISQN